ncbi:MAG TPA: hypothetical protein VIV84_03960 [Burkholderiaceae bacterium]
MRKAAWFVLAGAMLLAVLAAMGVAAFLVWGLPQEIGRVTVNGHVLDLHGAHAGHWLLATLGVLLALTVILVVVPTVALLAMIVPLSLAAIGLTVAALAVGLVLSPLLLLAWWLWKRSAKARTMAA